MTSMELAPNIILLGGAPAIGKSTLARAIARECAFDYVSTDMIRRVARTVTKKTDYPGMHLFAESDPEEYYKTHSTAEFVAHFQEEARDVFGIVQDMIKDYPAFAQRGVIIEGVNLMPEIAAAVAQEKGWRFYVLVAQNRETVAQTVENRGLWAKTPEGKENEIEFVWALNQHIAQQAEEFDVPVLVVESRATLDQRAKDAILGSYAK